MLFRVSLEKSWKSRGEVDAAEWAAKAEQLRGLREQLSIYVERLHHRHRNGITVYWAIGSVVSGEAVPDLCFSWPSPTVHDEAAMAGLRELTGRLQVNAVAVGPDNLAAGPLSPVYRTDWSARWQQEMVHAARVLGEESTHFAVAARSLCEQLAIAVPDLHQQMRAAFGQLAGALWSADGRPWAFCASPQSTRVCAELKTAGDLVAQHRQLSSQMSAPWPADLQARLLYGLDLLEQRRCIQMELGNPWPVAVRNELERGVQFIEEIARLRQGLSVNYGAGVANLNVSRLQREWAKAEKALWPASWLGRRRVCGKLDAVIDGIGEPRVAEDLEALVRIKALGEAIEQINPGVVVEDVWNGVKTCADHLRGALKANAALGAARAQRPYSMEGLAPVAAGNCGERWATEVMRLNTLRGLDRRIGESVELADASDGLWRGHDTDVGLLRTALDFERERLKLMERGALQAEYSAVAAGHCGTRLQQEHERLQARAAVETRVGGLDTLAVQCP